MQALLGTVLGQADVVDAGPSRSITLSPGASATSPCGSRDASSSWPPSSPSDRAASSRRRSSSATCGIRIRDTHARRSTPRLRLRRKLEAAGAEERVVNDWGKGYRLLFWPVSSDDSRRVRATKERFRDLPPPYAGILRRGSLLRIRFAES
jgi:hypothetical protein